ncbi:MULTISPECIES: DUF5985 family protein [unclassified Bradyrhizobium]|jgi:Family of unknown function (DUF5985)|uniref:DUF5985 family protein n=1 Tax=Bradyrhizobium sp. LLZ17 TaxID=3239388 RepID=A0AB39XU63_9BRAD
MSPFIYGLCAATSAVCAGMLLGAYRREKYSLLLWSGLCFVGLTLNNVVLVIDKIVLPDVDLSLWRLLIALVAMVTLLYGLIWDAE